MTQQQKNTETASDAWIADKPGDSVEGIVKDLDVAWSDFRAQHLPNDPNGGNYPLITVEKDNGDVVKIHAFRTVLYNEVAKRQPKPGERIKVTFVGEGEAKRKGQSPPHIYRVETPDRDPDDVAKNVYGRLPNAAPAAVADDEEFPF